MLSETRQGISKGVESERIWSDDALGKTGEFKQM